jgi:hypothetical protein
MKIKTLLFFLTLTAFLTACISDGGDEADISGIALEKIEIKRYGRDLFNIDPGHVGRGLRELAGQYRFFLGDNYDDTLNILQIRDYISDPFLQEIAGFTELTYPHLDDIEEGLTLAFKYYLYYFPEGNVPSFYSYISGVDFDHPMQYLDTVMILALDTYLGRDYIPYKRMRIPVYRTRRMQRPYIVPDCMREVVRVKHLPPYAGERLIDQMVYQGKILYFLDKVLPGQADTLKIGFTSRQLDWCYDNESNLWAFLVENELLYSTDFQQINKLMNDGPFTSFFDKQSPARTGAWVGWQIVRDYMENNRVSLQEMIMKKDAVEILTQSAYKP